MPWYRKHGKILTPITDDAWQKKMKEGHFVHWKHRAFAALLYYTAIRKSEALRTMREQFSIEGSSLVFNVGKRLKHGIETPSLKIPLEAPYMDLVRKTIDDTRPGLKVFPYSSKTGYNIIARAFTYPHFFRLSRITSFFAEGWTIAQVHSWTGLTLTALNYYIGLVDIDKMGKSLLKKQEWKQFQR